MIIDAMYMVNDGDTRIIKDGIFVAIVTFCIYLICIVTAYCVFSQLNCLNKIKGMCAFAVALSNTGLIGMPFIKEVYGNEALFYATVMEAINDVFIFTIGSIIIKQDITDKDKIDTNKMSVAMFTIGAQLGESRFREVFKVKIAYVTTFIRNICVPLVVTLFLRYLLKRTDLASNVLSVMMAMPTAACVAIITRKQKGDYKTATSLVVMSAIFSMISITLFYYIV